MNLKMAAKVKSQDAVRPRDKVVTVPFPLANMDAMQIHDLVDNAPLSANLVANILGKSAPQYSRLFILIVNPVKGTNTT